MPAKGDPHRFDDLFAPFGPITLRRFFGGEGICSGEIMFGMIFGERIYFKTDDKTRKTFLSEGCEPFSFEKRSTGETIVTGWYALPDPLYDDPEELARWAKQAYEVAARSETVVKKQRKRAREMPARQPARRRRGS
ncbi:MAG TPA: TfoX/Sxy family protein [Rhizomicrobium sp.]|jgi:DNA transformation protein and related proteins|nr:TfoX/Sxy family protein [Rhizomicrobium sp.]